MRLLALLAILIAVNGCCTPPLSTTDGDVKVEDLIRHIKYDVATYQNQLIANPIAEKNACKGNLSFKIRSITVALQAQTDNTVDVNGSASLPVGTVGSLGPSADLSGEHKQSVTTTFTFYIKDPDKKIALNGPDTSGFTGTPISDSLKDLRTSLLAASDTEPCFTFDAVGSDGKTKDQDNSIVYSFTVVKTAKGGATFKLLLFSFGATATQQKQSQNTITVKFVAPPGSQDFLKYLNGEIDLPYLSKKSGKNH